MIWTLTLQKTGLHRNLNYSSKSSCTSSTDFSNLSLSICPYHPSLPAGLLEEILSLYRAVRNKFLVGQLLHVCVKGSIGKCHEFFLASPALPCTTSCLDGFQDSSCTATYRFVGCCFQGKEKKCVHYFRESLFREDKFMYLSSRISSTENDMNMCIAKAWTAIDRSDFDMINNLSNKIKCNFFQAVVESILLYGCWQSIKRKS